MTIPRVDVFLFLSIFLAFRDNESTIIFLSKTIDPNALSILNSISTLALNLDDHNHSYTLKFCLYIVF